MTVQRNDKLQLVYPPCTRAVTRYGSPISHLQVLQIVDCPYPTYSLDFSRADFDSNLNRGRRAFRVTLFYAVVKCILLTLAVVQMSHRERCQNHD